MSATRDLLVELFVEELPPKALKALSEAFAGEVANGLIKRRLKQRVPDWKAFASPRRLAVYLPDVAGSADDRADEVKVMPASVGLAAGEPTPALLKKLASLGADPSAVPSLIRRTEGKAEVLFLKRTVRGQTLAEGLQQALAEALERLPIPKVMQYQLADGWTTVQFVRPAHGLVALHGAEVVPVTALGLEAGRSTRGHRFEARQPWIELRDASSYEAQLRDEGAVVAGFAERRTEIVRQLVGAADAAELVVLDDAALLDEVTALVERPNVLACEFDAEFLEVPPECLVLTMKANQKYFPLLDATGSLTNRFLVVSNITPADPSRVIEGNERVVRPRLADAKFFFDHDRLTTLDSRVAGLDRVVYHGKLGSQGERVARVQAIAGALADALCDSLDPGVAGQAERAARLAKADLLTDMVGEFPELQGVMGRYYALNDGEDSEVALAIEDHYRPRFAGDDLPRNAAGAIVAVADKLETLVGLFGIDQLPTGDKDPYALRRHALGVMRILTERLPGLPLDRAIDAALSAPDWPAAAGAAKAGPNGAAPLVRAQLLDFFADRLAASLVDRGYAATEVAAVLADDRFCELGEVEPRLAALRRFAELPEAAALAAANKRVGNILKKAAEPIGDAVDPGLLREPAEAALDAALGEVGARADAALAARDYAGSLLALAGLRAPVDAFFDAVMVNVDDPALRANRLALLGRLHVAMNRVADLSRLVT
ncbi:MAG: glycine--tRNA ligase subunit beta [Caldimonas sp.]